MRSEIYDFRDRIERYRRIISGLRNGQTALRMLDHLESLGLSDAAISNHAAHLVAVLRLIDFDVEKATRQDVERVVAAINRNQKWSQTTKYHKRAVLRRLVQFAKCGSCEKGAPVPPEVAWIKLSKNDRDSRVSPEALLTHQDFAAMVKAADNVRDRAMLYVLFEGALRPGELLSMNVGSVSFKDEYCMITVDGKTGRKHIPLVASCRPLMDWLEIHPFRDDPAAPLWCSLATNYKGKRLSYRHFRLTIKRLAERAGVKKSVWPYLFRHSTLTALAKTFTEAQLEQYAGWVHGSKMSRRYVHFSARALLDAVLKLHGFKTSSQTDGVLRLVACPRCRTENPAENVRCETCGFILDKKLAIKMEDEQRKKEDLLMRTLDKMWKRLNSLEQAVQSLLGHTASSNLQPHLSKPQSPSAPTPDPSF